MNLQERRAGMEARRIQLRQRLESPEHLARVKEALERRKVVEEALTWINTPVVSGGRAKGSGADCAFFAEVFRACGISEFLGEAYNADWFCNVDKRKYYRAVLAHSVEVFGEQAHHPGNIVLGKCFAAGEDEGTWWHGALIVNWPTIIHGYPPRVTLGDITLLVPFSGCQGLRFFSPWGV